VPASRTVRSSFSRIVSSTTSTELLGLRWLYDGEVYYDLEPEAVGDREWVFDHPFFIILNLALGGTLGGTIALDTEFPQHMYVDYVRVYQRG
jgi:beta-glucanase (GH16 family)